MLVFVDESGCTGFKFGKGSSNHFIVSMVFFEENSLAFSTASEVDLLRKSINWQKGTSIRLSRCQQKKVLQLCRWPNGCT